MYARHNAVSHDLKNVPHDSRKGYYVTRPYSLPAVRGKFPFD